MPEPDLTPEEVAHELQKVQLAKERAKVGIIGGCGMMAAGLIALALGLAGLAFIVLVLA